MELCEDCKATADEYHAVDDKRGRERMRFASALDDNETLHLADSTDVESFGIASAFCRGPWIQG